jgi:hypothetical protein
MASIFRQGDVLLRGVGSVNGTKTGQGSKVLAFGEVSGHKHVLSGKGVEFYNAGGQVLVSIPKSAELVHEEHEAITVPKGVYEVVIQREFDLVEGVREVLD